jgi:hypothetical protein
LGHEVTVMGDNNARAAWIAEGWGFKVKSLDDLMHCIGRVGTLQAGRRYVWRGVADSKWRVQSSLFRSLISEGPNNESVTEDSLRTRERILLREARLWGIGKELGGTGSDQQLLSILQHHGAPTRMLDVTSNPMTALWFSCQRASTERDAAGALMAFDVTSLTTLRTANHELKSTFGSVANSLGWHWEQALSESSIEGRPFVVQPSYPDHRMIAQEGSFLTGTVPDNPDVDGVDGISLNPRETPAPGALESLFSSSTRRAGRPHRLPFVVLVIPPKLKRSMLRHLETTFNRSYRQLFPDIAGFVTALQRRQVDMSPNT